MKRLILITLIAAISITSFAQEFENFYSGYFEYYSLHITDSLIFVGGNSKINIFRIDGTYKDTKYVKGDVYSITENSQGNIYFGVYSLSNDGAILIFDGYNWDIITEEDGLPDNRVSQLVCNQNDDLWVTFTNGSSGEANTPISRFDGSIWHNITTIGDTINIYNADEIAIDTNNTVFIGISTNGVAYDGGVLVINETDTIYYSYLNSDINLDLRLASYVDNNNHVWFGGNTHRLVRFDGTQWHQEAQDTIFNNLSFSSIGQDATGKMLLGTYEGLFKETNDGWIKYNDESGLMFNYIFDIKKDNESNNWMAAFPPSGDDDRKGCLTKLSDNSFTHYFPNTYIGNPKDISFSNNKMFTFGKTPTGSALSVFDGTSWNIDITNDSLYNISFRSVHTDNNENVWLGGYSGLYKISIDNTVEKIDTIIGDSITQVFSVACFNNNVWVSSNSKLYKYYQGVWSEIDITNLNYSYFYTILPVDENELWACNPYGAYFYNGNEWLIYDEENGLGESYYVNDIALYGDSVWLATRHGAVLIHNSNINTYLNDSSFHSGYSCFNSVHIDRNGLVWLVNKNGIAIYDFENVSYIQPAGYEEEIYSIREDDNCNIWVCGETALSKYHYNVNAIEETQINNNMLSIYPNPVKNEFFIDLSENTQNDVLEIYATNGTVVHEQAVKHGTNKIDLYGIKPGMYLVRVKTANIFGKIMLE